MRVISTIRIIINKQTLGLQSKTIILQEKNVNENKNQVYTEKQANNNDQAKNGEKWEEDRRKEKEEGNGNLEDVLENTSTATQGMERRQLWKDFVTVNRIVANHPWIMFGDFNITLNTSEHSAGGSFRTTDMHEFNDCINCLEMEDVCSSEAVNDEEKLMFQQAEVNWLCEGDINTKCFHQLLKSIKHSNIFTSICNENGQSVEGNQVAGPFLNHFQSFLRHISQCFPIDDAATLFTNKVTSDEAEYMIRDVSDNEIKEAMFDIGDCKAPRPNGYSSTFFKKAWTVVGNE
ncbi:RNA-directed DNA polymerase, eukaryota, reverse transcriptase zinc-binding domain protein, partial [Tanacetum coccineum]